VGINYSPKIVTDGLVLCLDAANPLSYPGSGNTWYDLDENKNNATITSGFVFENSNAGIFTILNMGNYANVVYDPQTHFADQSWSWEVFWSGRIHPNVTVHNMPQIGYGASSWPRLGIFRFANGSCEFWSYNNNGHASAFRFFISPANTGWIHSVVSADYENSVVKGYYNGDYYNQKIGFPVIANNNSNFGIGRTVNTAWNETLLGSISFVRIYNKALSANEVSQNYLATKGRFGL
jgi:hypothetical protein